MDTALLSGLRKIVEKTADEFEPGVFDIANVEQAVNEWAAIERIACSAKLRAAGRVEDLGLDPEATVAEASGLSSGQARRQTRLRKKLKNKKKTQDALDKGKLSPTQANAIGEAVDANPDAEQTLLDMAENGTSTSELLKECERIKRDALDADGSLGAKQKQARTLWASTDALGMTFIGMRLEPLNGAKFMAEVDRRADQIFRKQVRAKGNVDSIEQRRADAVIEILGSSVNGGGRARGPRTKVLILATKEAVERGYTMPGEKCETADGTPLPMAAVDEALLDKDTEVHEITFDEIDVRSMSSNKRYIPARIRDALAARGMCCSVPGCGHTKGLQKDHHEDFSKGGPTALLNLGWLCAYHHDLKTRGLFKLWRDVDGIVHWEPVPAQERRVRAGGRP